MLSTSHVYLVLASLLIFWVGWGFLSRKRLKGLPRVGIDPGYLGWRSQAAKAQFFEHGQQLLEQGYAQVGKFIPGSDVSLADARV
jgi:hypothetical protein